MVQKTLATIRSSHAIPCGYSAYASGALVKCRKVGAANWGNKSESFEVQESPSFEMDKSEILRQKVSNF